MKRIAICALLAGCIPAPGQSVFDPTGDADGDGVLNADDCAPTEPGSEGITVFADGDGDGFGDATSAHVVCAVGPGDVVDGTDCDDADSAVHPGQVWTLDYDSDGHPSDGWAVNEPPFYIPAVVIVACAQPDPFVDGYGEQHPYVAAPADDCGDDNPNVYPGAHDVCSNAIDDDCDGKLDTCALPKSAGMGAAEAIFADDVDDGGLGWPIGVAGDIRDDGTMAIAVGALDGGRVRLLDPQFTSAGLDSTAVIDVTGLPTGAMTRGAAAGDVDRDGNDDLIVSSFAESGLRNGGAWLLFGPITADIGASTGLAITASGASAQLGWQVGTVGDVDDDGFSDVIVTDPELPAGGGRAYVFAGNGLRERSGVRVEDDAAWTITGTAPGDAGLGASFAALGDMDADGIDDFALGTFGAAPDGGMEAFLVLGGSGGGGIATAAEASACDLRSHQLGDGRPFVGLGLASAGDIDGDGVNEILLGGHGDAIGGPGAGRAWLVTSIARNCGNNGIIDLDSDPLAWNVAQFVDSEDASLGYAVAGLGDADGDGFSDFAIAGNGAANGSSDAAGVVYLVSGRPLVTGATWDLASVDADRIVWSRIRGSSSYQGLGAALAGPGDLDGDGSGDLVVGDFRAVPGPADPRVILFLNGIEE